MSPKIIDKEQRKYEIALVALEVFAEKGFEASSISEVAKLAGIGKGTIYEYFVSKEELILTAMMVWIDQMMQGVDGLLEGITDPIERLRTYANAAVEAFVSDEQTVKIMINMFQAMLTGDMLSKQHPITAVGSANFSRNVHVAGSLSLRSKPYRSSLSGSPSANLPLKASVV